MKCHVLLFLLFAVSIPAANSDHVQNGAGQNEPGVTQTQIHAIPQTRFGQHIGKPKEVLGRPWNSVGDFGVDAIRTNSLINEKRHPEIYRNSPHLLPPDSLNQYAPQNLDGTKPNSLERGSQKRRPGHWVQPSIRWGADIRAPGDEFYRPDRKLQGKPAIPAPVGGHAGPLLPAKEKGKTE